MMKFFSKHQESGAPIQNKSQPINIEQYIQQRCQQQNPQILPVEFFAELLNQFRPTQQQVDAIVNSIVEARKHGVVKDDKPIYPSSESNIYKLLGRHNIHVSNIFSYVEQYNCKVIKVIPKMATESILVIEDNLGQQFEIRMKSL